MATATAALGVFARGRGAVSAAVALAGRPLRTTGAVVLGYHDVGDGLEHTTRYHVPSSQLRVQLDAAREFGVRFVDAAMLVTELRAGRPIDGLGAVTFDDALGSFREHALELLAELAVPATVFVATRERGVRPSFFDSAERTMTQAELAEIVAAGARLGSHTVTHRILAGLPAEELERELADSRKELEDVAGTPVDLLAYPGGRNDATVRRAAAQAGYRAAFTFHNGRVLAGDDPFALPRLTMGPHHTRARLAYHLARPAASWPPDTQET